MARRDAERGRDRLERIMNQRLKEIKLQDRTVSEASGPQLVMINGDQGQQMHMGWMLTVWLEHDKLLGQPPIAVSIPVGGILPEDHMIALVAAKLLEEARKLRHRAENPDPQETPDAAAMMAKLQAQVRQNGQS